MSAFTSVQKPAIGNGRKAKLSAEELEAVVTIVKSGEAARSDQLGNQKGQQQAGWSVRHQVAQALKLDPEKVKSRTIKTVEDDPDSYAYEVFLVD